MPTYRLTSHSMNFKKSDSLDRSSHEIRVKAIISTIIKDN